VLKNKLRLLVLINSALILFIISFFIYKEFSNSNKLIVYVDNNKLFDGFYMTKEMKKIGEKEFNARKTILDTLYAKLQSTAISEGDKKAMMSQFIQGKQELEQFNQSFAATEVTKIWSRIHGYTEDFSKENKYQLIVGSDNKNTILFASEKIDITNDLLAYINKKYEGVK
jgi:outer membrane protein